MGLCSLRLRPRLAMVLGMLQAMALGMMQANVPGMMQAMVLGTQPCIVRRLSGHPLCSSSSHTRACTRYRLACKVWLRLGAGEQQGHLGIPQGGQRKVLRAQPAGRQGGACRLEWSIPRVCMLAAWIRAKALCCQAWVAIWGPG